VPAGPTLATPNVVTHTHANEPTGPYGHHHAEHSLWSFYPSPLNKTTLKVLASIPAPDVQAAIAVAAALTGVAGGGRYVAEGNGPTDFDCSGLTAWAWRQAGVPLVDYSYTQRAATTAIPRGAWRP